VKPASGGNRWLLVALGVILLVAILIVVFVAVKR
jgi:hypothetical protein